MVLRLSSSTTTATTTSGNPTLDRLLQDGSLSTDKKVTCLKTLQVVLKNLMDPTKSQDVKYRTLKCTNAKMQERLLSIEYIRTELLASLGFQPKTVEGEAVLVVDLIDTNITQTLQTAVNLALQTLVPVTASQSNISNTSTTSSFSSVSTGLSEKQKARRLMEEKQKLEKQKAIQERKRNLALLKQDKITRETDPNWKPGLSAACAKSGSSISTFRDKYGEN